MTSPIEVKYIVRDTLYGGKPRIQGHRIAVHDIAVAHRQGQTPETMARDYHLTLAQIYAALAYYYDHKEEIDSEISAEDAEIKACAQADNSPLAQRVRQALAERRQRPADE